MTCSPCLADEELFTARDTEPAPPAAIVTADNVSTFVRRGDAFGERGYVECHECGLAIVAGDTAIYARADTEFSVCDWCLGCQPIEQEQEESMPTIHEFYETVKAIAKAHDRKSFVAVVQVHGTDADMHLQWEGYIDGTKWVTGPSASYVVETLRKLARGEELCAESDVAALGTPPEPRAA